MSCDINKEKRDAIRRTWAQDVPVDIDTLFFVGNENVDHRDSIQLDCPDDYESCYLKQWRMIEFLKDYDYVFFCDDDTYVVVDRLLTCGYEQHDYMGCPCEIENGVIMAHGGAGFWMSKSAMRAALMVGLNHPEFVKTIYSDRMVGHLMHIAGYPLYGDGRFNLGKYIGDKGICNLRPNRENSYITTHFVTVEWFDKIYNHFKKGDKLPSNDYYMNILGSTVAFLENGGKWYYMVNANRQFIGEFELACQAENHAIEMVKKLVAERSTTP
jgi:hypothetical protein